MATSIRNLLLEERIKLLEDLWDSIAAQQERLPLTPDQQAELDDRLDEIEVDGEVGEPAATVLTRIRRAL